MLIDVVAARPLEPYRIHLRFANGVEGDVDLEEMIEFRGVFEPLRDPERFREVSVHPEFGTIVWPNGADLDPDVLYATVTGEAIDVSGRPSVA
ncbi:MAG: DUF2442 domain-containing protein [Gemmatimonadetes bacterium]|nr:DUF2442 domain-containing protein [Gemmatimonadota bacterium]